MVREKGVRGEEAVGGGRREQRCECEQRAALLRAEGESARHARASRSLE